MSGGAEDAVQGESWRRKGRRGENPGRPASPQHRDNAARRVPPLAGGVATLHMEREEDWGPAGFWAGWRGPAQGAGAVPTSVAPPGSTHRPAAAPRTPRPGRAPFKTQSREFFGNSAAPTG